MQRRHRRRHLKMWVVIGAVVGAGFVAGLALRQTRPVETQKFSEDDSERLRGGAAGEERAA